MKNLPVVLLLVVGLFLAAPAHASLIQVGTSNFQCIVGSPQCNAAQAFLTVDVFVDSVGAPTQAQFSFNNATASSAIIHVYFEDNASLFLSFAGTVTNGAGVNFTQDGSPATLPTGNNLIPSFNADATFSSGTLAEGVDPGESLKVLFSLNSGVTVSNILNDLNNDTLRVAVRLHQGTTSLISIGDQIPVLQPDPEPAPEPGSFLLVAGSLGLVSFVLRRRNRAC